MPVHLTEQKLFGFWFQLAYFLYSVMKSSFVRKIKKEENDATKRKREREREEEGKTYLLGLGEELIN